MRAAAGFLSCVALLVATFLWLGEAVTPGAVTEIKALDRTVEDHVPVRSLSFDRAIERAILNAHQPPGEIVIAQLPAAGVWQRRPVERALDHAPVSVADLVPTTPGHGPTTLAPVARPRSIGLAILPIDGAAHRDEITANHEFADRVAPDSLALLSPATRPQTPRDPESRLSGPADDRNCY